MHYTLGGPIAHTAVNTDIWVLYLHEVFAKWEIEQALSDEICYVRLCEERTGVETTPPLGQYPMRTHCKHSLTIRFGRSGIILQYNFLMVVVWTGLHTHTFPNCVTLLRRKNSTETVVHNEYIQRKVYLQTQAYKRNGKCKCPTQPTA